MLIVDLIKEYVLILKNYFIQYRCSIPSDWNNGTKGSVILIYGLNENWTYLKTISNVMNKEGFCIHVLKFNSRDRIVHIVKEINQYIIDQNLINIVLVGHSKGGLIARTLFEEKSLQNRIDKCIVISTPNNGSIIGYLGLISLNELKPKSLFISDLNANSKRNSEIYNFYPKFDNHIIPNKNLILNGAINKLLDINGHTRILESPLLIENIKTIIKDH